MSQIEYRVRPVTRYIVTRYEKNEGGGSCTQKGEFQNEELASEIAKALARPENATCTFTLSRK